MSIIPPEQNVDERAQFAPALMPSDLLVLPQNLLPQALDKFDLPIKPVSGLALWGVSQGIAIYKWTAVQITKELARGVGFLCLPVLMGGGVLAYYALPFEPNAVMLIAIIALLGLSLSAVRKYPFGFFSIAALLAVFLGMGSAQFQSWSASTAMMGSDIATGITGRVVKIEHQASGRFRLTLDVLGTERPKLRYAPDRVRLTARDIPPELRSGDVVQGYARLMQPSGPVRPGGYDFSFGSYFNGIGATGFFLSSVTPVVDDAPPSLLERPMRLLESIREALAERIREHVSGPEGEVVVALIVGYRAGIPEDMNEALRRSGLAHILSISGLHMALVAGTVMLMMRSIFAFFPIFSSRMPVKKYAAAAAVLFCTLYLSLSGGDVAAQRSYFMLAIMLIALLFDRAAISMRNVAIAALVIILVAPHEVVGPSFQMSFSATAALVAGFAAWTEWRSQRHRAGAIPSRNIVFKTSRYIIGSIGGLSLTSIIAGAATAIYGIWHFQRATPMSLPSNLAAMPAVSIVVMPCAVLAILAMPFGLEGYFLQAMQWGIGVMVAVAVWFSDRSPIDAVGLLPGTAMMFLTLALLVLILFTTRLRLIALPLIALGGIAMMDRSLPDIMISEDARLVAIRGEGGTLAVNRPRPSSFSMDDWKRALLSDQVIAPKKGPLEGDTETAGFICDAGVCLAHHSAGALIVHSQKAADAFAYCTQAALIIVEDATVEQPCGANARALVLTGRDLARRGSASVYVSEDAPPNIVQAIVEPWRPWHQHRAFSRAARGKAPYERRKPTPKTAPKPTLQTDSG